MGGGGGEDFAAQAAAAEAKKQAARDALNLQFGVAPTSRAAPNRADFITHIPGTQQTINTPNGDQIFEPGTPDQDQFDENGYLAAQHAFDNLDADAAKNKAAREALYGQARTDAFTAGSRKLGERRDQAQRDLKFTLFGQGLNGGSADVDENAKLGRTYTQGVLDLGSKADQTAADLRSNDEQTRLGLLQSIDSGLDQGSALSSATNQLRVNSDKAAASAAGADLGDLFGNAGLLYTKSQAARGRTDAQNQWLYGTPATAYRRPGGNFGTISGTGGP